MVSQAELILRVITYSLVPGLISILVEMVWVPLKFKVIKSVGFTIFQPKQVKRLPYVAWRCCQKRESFYLAFKWVKTHTLNLTGVWSQTPSSVK